jgi:hypothetical protein
MIYSFINRHRYFVFILFIFGSILFPIILFKLLFELASYPRSRVLECEDFVLECDSLYYNNQSRSYSCFQDKKVVRIHLHNKVCYDYPKNEI